MRPLPRSRVPRSRFPLRRRPAPTYFFGYSPLRAVRVSGHSMSPTLNWGDWVLFRRYRAPGDLTVQSNDEFERALRNLSSELTQKVVLIARLGPSGQRDLMQIKRVMKVELVSENEIGIWVEGDNAAASSDSRHWGHVMPEEIIGIYFRRYHLG